MDKRTLELYLYMNNTKPIIEWLKKEGCKTQKQVINKLKPIVKSNMLSVASHIGQGNRGVSLAGTAYGVEKIINQFKK